ncbi:MAG: hypothetical protein WBI40_09270 [Methylococcaceae bacterium]
MKPYSYNLLVSIDQFFNTLAGGNPDVTISSKCATMAMNYGGNWNRLRKLIDFTFAPIEKNHCQNSMLADNDYDLTQNYFLTCIVATIGCALLFIPIRILGAFKHG